MIFFFLLHWHICAHNYITTGYYRFVQCESLDSPRRRPSGNLFICIFRFSIISPPLLLTCVNIFNPSWRRSSGVSLSHTSINSLPLWPILKSQLNPGSRLLSRRGSRASGRSITGLVGPWGLSSIVSRPDTPDFLNAYQMPNRANCHPWFFGIHDRVKT